MNKNRKIDVKTRENKKNPVNVSKKRASLKKTSFLASLVSFFCISFSYADMNAAFQAGENFGHSQSHAAIVDAQSGNPNIVPGYQGDHPGEEQYKNADIKNIAKEKVNTDPTGQFVNQSNQKRVHESISKDDSFVKNSDVIVKNANTVAKNSAYCSGGNCTDTSYQPSPDFNQAVSGLSASGAGSKDMNVKKVCKGFLHPVCTYQYSIFTGSSMSCRIIPLGYSDCCSDDGWGHDLGLAGCNDEEKQLGLKKEAKTCHYVGEYCSKSIDLIFGSICIEHSKNYCCFNSKLGRMVQEQGRAQLHQGWGSGEHPDCHGFTPEEMQKVDFSKIDFSDFYGDIQKEMHVPNISGTQEHIKNEAGNDINSGSPNS